MSNQQSAAIPKLFFAGGKGTGKTMSTKYIQQKIPGTVSLAFAKPLKDACKALFLLSDFQLYDEHEKERKDPRWGVSPRQLLQRVGDLLRHGLPLVLPELKLDRGLIFTQNMYWRLQDAEEENPPLLIIEDGRLPDEHNFFKLLERTRSIRIHRNTGSTDQHASEKINFRCDVDIINNGSADQLYSQLDNILLDFLQPRSTQLDSNMLVSFKKSKIEEKSDRIFVRASAVPDMPYAEYYKNTFFLDESQLNLYKNRFSTVDPRRKPIHEPCRSEYVPVEHKNFYVRFARSLAFNFEHFNCALWTLILPEETMNPAAQQWEFPEPCVLFVFMWTDLWQHFMQDLVPVLVSAKAYLDKNPTYRLIVLRGVNVQWIRDLLGIVNPITEVELGSSHRTLSHNLITFVPIQSSQPANVVSNIRKIEYYSQANTIIRESIRRRFPEVDEKVAPYILYLSRKNSSRTVSQDEEIRNLDSRIRVFNLQEQDVPFWDRFKLFYNASMVIAPHGGAVYHVLACRPNTPMIELFGAYNFINCEHLANGIPLTYFPLMTLNMQSHDSHQPYDIDVSLIREIIELFFSR